MSDYTSKQLTTHPATTPVAAAQSSPGKRTLVEQVYGPGATLQRRAAGEGDFGPAGTGDSGELTRPELLPRGDAVARLFGRNAHEVAHTVQQASAPLQRKVDPEWEKRHAARDGVPQADPQTPTPSPADNPPAPRPAQGGPADLFADSRGAPQPTLEDMMPLGPGEGKSGAAAAPATQNAPASPIQLPAPEPFSAKYKSKKSHPGQTFDDYKAAIGTNSDEPTLQKASDYAGSVKIAPIAISRGDLGKILNPRSDVTIDAALDKYLNDINRAFEIAELDTVESQADYLAHAAGETGSLVKLEEKAIQQKIYDGFQGRGPVQVTHEYMYVQTLAYLQLQAEILAKSSDPKDQQNAMLAQEAVNAIKRDPRNAADQKYSFLFSAMYMHMTGGVRKSAQLNGAKDGKEGRNPDFNGPGVESNWVTGGEDLAAKLRAVEGKLTTAKRKLAGDLTDPSAAPATIAADRAAVETGEKDAQERRSTVGQAGVKAATYGLAVKVLSAKKVAAPATP